MGFRSFVGCAATVLLIACMVGTVNAGSPERFAVQLGTGALDIPLQGGSYFVLSEEVRYYELSLVRRLAELGPVDLDMVGSWSRGLANAVFVGRGTDGATKLSYDSLALGMRSSLIGKVGSWEGQMVVQGTVARAALFPGRRAELFRGFGPTLELGLSAGRRLSRSVVVSIGAESQLNSISMRATQDGVPDQPEQFDLREGRPEYYVAVTWLAVDRHE